MIPLSIVFHNILSKLSIFILFYVRLCYFCSFKITVVLNLFRINDPFRLVPIFLLLLLLRVGFISVGVPVTALEAYWLTLGEKLNTGAVMYIDIWDNTPPFAALVYWFLAKFGKSLTIHHSFALLLVMIQAYVFNAVLLRKNIHREKSYIPALLYVLLMVACFDFLTLSPLLISMTFLVLLLRNIFWLNEGAKDEDIFSIGIYLGLAILSHLPNWLFIFFVLLCITFFRTVSLRQYLLLLYGLVLTVGAVALFYGWVNSFEAFFSNYFFSFFSLNFTVSYVSIQSFSAIFGVLFFFLLLSIIKTYTERGFINYQSLCQLIMILWVIVGIISMFFGQRFAPLQFIILLPSLVFFMTFFFLIIKRAWLSEILFLLTWGIVIGLGYYSLHYLRPMDINYVTTNALKDSYAIKNKKILVLGDNFLPYYMNTIATPYLNWTLSQEHFKYLNTYKTTIEVYNNFTKELPDFIIDEKNFMPTLTNRIPMLGNLYEKPDKNLPVFRRKK